MHEQAPESAVNSSGYSYCAASQTAIQAGVDVEQHVWPVAAEDWAAFRSGAGTFVELAKGRESANIRTALIESVAVRQLRCFESCSIDFDALTILVGPNSSGKSTVIEAVYWLLTGKGIGDTDRRTSSSAAETGPVAEVSATLRLSERARSEISAVIGAAVPAVVTVRRRCGEGDGRLSMTIPRSRVADLLAIRQKQPKAEGYSALRDEHPEWKLPEMGAGVERLADMDALINGWLAEHEAADPSRYEAESSDLTAVLGRLLQVVRIPAHANFDSEIADNPFPGQLSEAGEEAVASAARTHRDTLAEIYERERDRLVGDAETALAKQLAALGISGGYSLTAAVEPGVPKVVYRGELAGAGGVPLRQHGHGNKRAMLWATLMARAERARADGQALLLLIEEPELHQHDTRERHFMTVLEDLAAGGTQLIYATHSARFAPAHRFENIRRLDRSSSVTSASRGAVARRIKVYQGKSGDDVETTLRLPRQLTPTMSVAFFADAVLLVEGIDDEVFVRSMSEILGMPLDLYDIAVVQVGKGGFLSAAAILECLRIPFHALVDSDRGGAARTADKFAAKKLPSGELPSDEQVAAVCAEVTKSHRAQTERLMAALADPAATPWSGWESACDEVHDRCTLLADRLEELVASAPTIGKAIQGVRGDYRIPATEKPGAEVYRHLPEQSLTPDDVPGTIRQLVALLVRLTRPAAVTPSDTATDPVKAE